MGGYIGARSGVGLVTTTVGNVQDLTATDTTPEVTIVNSTHEDTDGGREGKVIFKGQQSGGEETTLAEIQGSHDGTADDEAGDLIFKTNDGSDGTSPTERLRIDSNGSILTATLGTDNVHLGEGAGDSIASGGNYNVAIGKDAGTALTTGDSNVAVGIDALKATTTSNHNVAIGKGALESNLTGEKNIAIGSAALDANTTGDQNVAIGNSALGAMNITDGSASYNTAVGADAGKAVTTGTENTLIGSLAGDALTVGNSNVAVGVISLSADTKGDRNVAVGYGSLASQNFTSTTDSYNTAVGFSSGNAITTGTNNTLIGALAGDACVDGVDNVAVGKSALSADAADRNVAVGSNALNATTASQNTAVGQDAAQGITTGINNTAMGYASVGQTTATGSYNSCYGYASGYSLSSGGNNTLIGANAGRSSAPGGTYTTGSNAVVIGDNGVTAAYIKVSWSVTSDERDKADFTPLDLGLDFVKGMQPYTFKWDQRSDYGDNTADNYSITDQTPDGTHKKDQLDVGFKAQDIETLEKAAGYKIDDKTNLISSLSHDETQYALRYEKFIPILTKAIQELSTKNDALEAQNTTQATQIADLITRVTALEAE